MSREPLSEREREILRLVAIGATNQRIANELSISINTVKVHVRNIFAKIGAGSRAEAVMYAVRSGLLQVGESETPGVGEETAVPSAALAIDPHSGAGSQGWLAPVQPSFPLPLLWLGRRRLALLALGAVIGLLGLLTFMVGPFVRGAEPTSLAATPEGGGRWRELASLPEPRAAFAFAGFAFEGKQYLYVIGGDSDAAPSNETLRYEPSTDLWVSMSDKPLAVADVRAAVVGGRIYVPGGRTDSGAISDQLDVYDPQHDRWTTLAPLPEPRSGYAVAAAEGKLYLLGGWDGSTYRADVWQYSPDDDVWRARAPMPTARAFTAVAVVDQQIHVLGGQGATGTLSVNERYSPASEGTSAPWSTKAPIPAPVERSDATMAGSLMMLAGAESAAGQLIVYNPVSDSWTVSQIPLPPLRDLRVQAILGKIYLAGGFGEGELSARVFEYQAVSTIFVPVIR